MEKTIEELRSFMDRFTVALGSLVEGVMVVARDEVAELLSQYNEFVPACNERLQHCAGLLGKGLRDEALGYETDEPALLATVDLLDLESRPQWSMWLQALQELGFPAPPMPKVEVAAGIREAQDARDKLKPLLDQWRRNNLANAPLATRIGTLRRLRKEDPNNESWFECLKAHEKQRAMQIESEVKAKAAANDEEGLSRIMAELQAEWLESPPSRVVQTVVTSLRAIQGSRLDRDIQQTADQLAAALDARDLDAGRKLCERWTQLADEKGAFSMDDERFMKAAPVLEWVARHDRLELLFSEVWQSLDIKPSSRNAKREWVRSLARMRDEVEDLAEKLQEEIDLEPIERLRGRVARVEDEQRRDLTGRRRLMFLVVGASTALVIAVVATTVSVLRHNDRIRQALVEVDGLLKKLGDGEMAPDQVPSLDWPESLKADPVVQSRLERLDNAVKEEERRRAQLAESLQALDESLESLAKAPRPESIKSWPDQFVAATKLLAEITNTTLAKTTDDKAAITKADGRLQNAAKRLQRDADELLDTQIRQLATRVAALRTRAKANPAEVEGELLQLERDTAALRDAATQIAAPGSAGAFAQMTIASRNASQPLRADGSLPLAIASVKQGIDEWRRFEKSEKSIDEAVGDWPRYAERLAAAAAEFPKQAIARDYGEAAKDAALWTDMEQWNRFAETVRPVAELPATQAKAMVDEIAKVRSIGSKLGFGGVIDRLEAALTSFANRDAAAAGQTLEKWLASQWLGEIEWIVTPLDQSEDSSQQLLLGFYCLDKPQPDSKRFKYLTGIKDEDGNWPEMKVQSFKAESVKVDQSPQKKLADELEKHCVSRIPEQAHGLLLDELLIDAVKRTLSAKTVEPCLRMLTLRKILSLGQGVSIVFQDDKARDLLGLLDDGNGGVPGIEVDELGAFIPPTRQENDAYTKVRRFSENIISKKAPLVIQKLELDAQKIRAILIAPSFPVFNCVGRLGHNAAGEIVVVRRSSAKLSPGDALLVVNGDGSIRKIGSCGDDARMVLETRLIAAGTPVFAERRKEKK